jgi:hypothetical protein
MIRILAVAALIAGCGGSKPPIKQLTRVPTAGEELLALLPRGADAVLELDVARLRENPTLGPLVSQVAANRSGELGFAPLADVDLMVVAVYAFGRDDATTLTLLRGASLPADTTADRVGDGEAFDAHTIIAGPDDWRGRMRVLPRKQSLVEDPRFRRDRDLAMPEKATGASVRLTVRLNKQARIRAAGRLGVDEVPGQISLWADVADDFALLALLAADDEAGAKRAEDSVRGLARGLTAVVPAESQLAELLGTLEVDSKGPVARVRWVVGPRRLQRWVKAMQARVVKSPP